MADWKNLPKEMVILIAHKLEFLQDFTRLSATCKPWRSALSDRLQFSGPWLLLAEDTDLDLSATRVSHVEATNEIRYLGYIRGDFIEDDQTTEIDRIIRCSVEYLFNNTSSVRGLFSLATKKVYNLDLPEATDRVILATSNGWLVTIGRDLEINLLHPLLKHQFPLPPMLTLPSQYEYDDDFSPQEVYTMFITKVVMSSNIPTDIHEDADHSPTIMVIYGEGKKLAFARVGDKLWSDVRDTEECLEDIIYHRGMFYAIDITGDIFICEPDHNVDKRQLDYILTKKIPNPLDDHVQNYLIKYASAFYCHYLIESAFGSHIWVVFRRRKGEYFTSGKSTPGKLRYYTSDFLVLKLEVEYSGCGADPLYHWTTNVKELGDEALFIGRASSKSVASSEFIKSNSIYFTDDMREQFCGAGGHDMGIFDMKTGTIQPHFEEISLHPFSPPLWYF